ncbi:carotenoid oxygenase family protein [Pseudonocardia spinosispora]|uniref:carotenoid oxygenase family protein n=1 Tax=Pseudonocardia spinosispora TaxID=103441 RepID=UPI00040D1114|nr:carotenoid oxygenase family protein [Pseudonocardia spinosispora]
MSNLFLTGNFAPATREETITTLSVTGRIPDHLDGRYLRIGPNPVMEVDPDTYNWFSLYGDGMVHGVRLRDGKAEWYRNRWVRTPDVARALGERPSRPNHRAGNHMIAANTNVIGHAGRTLALIEGGTAGYELGEELETLGECDFDGTLTGGYTGHPKRDPVTGELHAVSYRNLGRDVAQYSVIGVDGRVRGTVDFDVPGKPVLHDIALTENYVLFFDVPLVFDRPAAVSMVVPDWMPRSAQLVLSSLLGKVSMPESVAGRLMSRDRVGATNDYPFTWDASHPSRIGVLPRDGVDAGVRWFDIEPCYVFHTLNAYEENGSIVCDAVRLQGYDGDAKYDIRDAFDSASPTLHRWVVDLASGKVRESGIDDQVQEFPGVDPRLLGRRHRYGYTTAGTVNLDPTREQDAILRHDMEQNRTTTHSLPRHHRAGEFSFVPTSVDGAENDGVLMGFVYDETTGLSNLTLLDAATMEPMATVRLPARVPFGFHGNWVS